MAITILGRTLISDSFGITAPVFTDAPEAPPVKHAYLTRAQVCKKLRISDDDFESALSLSFPTASKRTSPGQYGFTLIWREDRIDQWVENQRENAKRITALVGKVK